MEKLDEYLASGSDHRVVCVFANGTAKRGVLTGITKTVSLCLCTVVLDDPKGKELTIDGTHLFPETIRNMDCIDAAVQLDKKIAKLQQQKNDLLSRLDRF